MLHRFDASFEMVDKEHVKEPNNKKNNNKHKTIQNKKSKKDEVQEPPTEPVIFVDHDHLLGASVAYTDMDGWRFDGTITSFLE